MSDSLNGYIGNRNPAGVPQIAQMTQMRKLRNEAMRSTRQFKVRSSRFQVRQIYETNPPPPLLLRFPYQCLIRVPSVATQNLRNEPNGLF
jgi:hypothetical protein